MNTLGVGGYKSDLKEIFKFCHQLSPLALFGEKMISCVSFELSGCVVR